MRRKRKREYKSHSAIIFTFAVLLCLAFLPAVVILDGFASVSDAAYTVHSTTIGVFEKMNIHSGGSKTSEKMTEWNLILVNKDNPIPKNYHIEFTLLSNGERVDSRIYPDLQEMFDEARTSGLQLFVREGYRTGDEQRQIFEDKIEAYRNEGHSKSESRKLAEEWVAAPGTSEHEIGLAVDINADTSVSSRDDVYLWLRNNAHRFGFILRYPQGKQDWTGVEYEPWHFRYVGKDAALEMYQQDLCLEEYLQSIQ